MKTKIQHILCLLILMWLASAPLYSQPTWQRTFGSVYTDRASEMISTASGGYALVGTIGFDDPVIGHAAYIVNVNSEGDTIWTKSYQIPYSTNATVAFAICQADDGGFLIGGSIEPFDTLTTFNSFLLRLDPFGDSLWSKIYFGNDMGLIYQIINVENDNYIIRGFLDAPLFSSVSKINDWGEVSWSIDSLYGDDIVLTPDTHYLLLKWAGTQIDQDPRLVKIDTGGIIVWDRTYNYTTGFEVNRRVIHLTNGNYLIMGGSTKTRLLEVNSDGDSLWSNTISEPQLPAPIDIVQTTDGGFMVLAQIPGPFLDIDIHLQKIDASGQLEWSVERFNTGKDENPISLGKHSDGGFVIFGWRQDGPIGGDDWLLLKIDSLAGIVGVQEDSDSDPQSIKFYPNPVNDWLEFDFEILISGYVTLYDLSGKLIFSDKFMDVDKSKLFVGEIKPGSYLIKISDLNHRLLAKELLVKY